MQSDFDAAAARFEPASIDLIHIDGFHTHDAVKHDFETWLSKMSDRGVMIFHDTMVKHKDFGVWKFWEEVSCRYPSFNFEHGAGLGVLAVGTEVLAPFRLWLDSASTQPLDMRQLFHGLGLNVERQRLLHGLLTQVFHARAIVTQVRKHNGLPVSAEADNAQAITANPLIFVRDMAREIQEIASVQPSLIASR